MLFKCLAVATVTTLIFAAGPVSSASVPRDVSVLSSVFGWFESAVEMLFGFFTGQSDKPNNLKIGYDLTGSAAEEDASTTAKKRSPPPRPARSYKGYQMVRVTPDTEIKLQDLRNLEDEPELEFWKPPLINRSTDLIAPPDVAQYLKQYLKERGIEYTVLSSNLEAEIKRQNPKPAKNNREDLLKTDRGHLLTWTRYHRYKDIEGYMDYLEKTMPGLVSVNTIGKSVEGRPLKVVRIGTGKKKKSPAIWVDAGIHGREWIAPATALFILKQLTENYKTNKAVVDGIDWYIMPVANPDGYEYSHTNDRFWRKSRSKRQSEGDDYYYDEARFFWSGDSEPCDGVDLNRNWDFHWREVGASTDPCKANFAGKAAFSEPETRAISEFILDNKDRIKAYLTLHAYSQMMLLPWGYTKQSAKDFDDLMQLGKRALDALTKVHGTEYRIGTSPSLLYPTSGSSDDWAKGKAGIKYSYTLELRDKGTFGFLLPASQIIPTGRETFAALKTIAKHINSTSS